MNRFFLEKTKLNQIFKHQIKSFSSLPEQPKIPKHKVQVNNGYRQPHPVWDIKDAENIEFTHYTPKTFCDKYAYFTIKLLRKSFDFLTRYNPKKMNETRYLTRAIFLETVAGVPGMVGGMHRHMRSLRGLREDGGWIHHLLEEAENERMHLLTFLQIRQPGLMLRFSILVSQYLFILYYGLHYMFMSKTAHRIVGYLEEEAVKTYTNMIKDYDLGHLPRWQRTRPSKEAIEYWELPENATMRDLLVAIRADEVNHREYNHYFANLEKDDPMFLNEGVLINKEKKKEIEENLNFSDKKI